MDSEAHGPPASRPSAGHGDLLLNLSQANALGGATLGAPVPGDRGLRGADAGARSMHAALGRTRATRARLQRYYVYNSVSYDTRACGTSVPRQHVWRWAMRGGLRPVRRLPVFRPAPAPASRSCPRRQVGLRALLVS